MAKEFLSRKGVPFKERDVTRDSTAASEVIRLTGQRSVPVITVDGKVMVGFNRQELERLLQQAGPGRRPFGLKIADASRIALKTGALPVFGAYVGAVAPGSPAEQAGLRAGDIITEVNMRRINNAEDFEAAIKSLSAGSRVQIVFMRSQETLRGQTIM